MQHQDQIKEKFRRHNRVMMLLGAATYHFRLNDGSCPDEFNESIATVAKEWGQEDLIEDTLTAAWS